MYFFMSGGRRFVDEVDVELELVGDGGAREELLPFPFPAVEMDSPSMRFGSACDMVRA
jgi:hypothetical protein